MTKELFLFELTQQLNNLPKEERDRTREYYSEMIADRMEGGMDESEAVAALGDPESIARGVLQSWRELNASKPVPQQTQPRALSSVSIEDPSGDITVESGAENGAYELQYENCSAEDYSLSEQDGALVIRYIRQKPEKPFSFFNMLSSRRLTVRLAGSVESLSVRTSSGDIEISDQNVNMLSLSSASGDMALHGVHCTADAMLSSASGNLEAQDFIAANAEIHTASGDISLENATLSGDARIQTRSGEVKLEHLSADSLFAESVSGDLELSELRTANAIQAATVSGDVELRDAQAGPCTIKTVSGDLQARDCAFTGAFQAALTSGDCSIASVTAEQIQLSAMSGDLHLDRAQSRRELIARTKSGDIAVRDASGCGVVLSTANGDIRGTLRDLPGGYDFRVKSSLGDVRVPDSRGTNPVEATTSYGDISLRVE